MFLNAPQKIQFICFIGCYKKLFNFQNHVQSLWSQVTVTRCGLAPMTLSGGLHLLEGRESEKILLASLPLQALKVPIQGKFPCLSVQGK